MEFFISIQILIHVENSVRKQWSLVLVYTVCLCPTKRTLGLYGLSLGILIQRVEIKTFFYNIPIKIKIFCDKNNIRFDIFLVHLDRQK